MSEAPDLTQLGKRVATLQDAWLERAVPLEAARDEFLLRAGAARRSRRIPLLLAAALAIGACVGVLVLVLPRTLLAPAPVVAKVNDRAAGQDTFIHSTAGQNLPIDFSDGSRITLEPSSRVRIAERRSTGATLAVESGGLDVSVKHQRDTDYRLRLGPFLVRVTGTRFKVRFSPEQDVLRVTMTEGAVVVSGCALGDPRPLRAGESLLASCRDSHFEISRGEAAQSSPSALPQGAAPSGAESEVAREPVGVEAANSGDAAPVPSMHRGAGEPSWQALARAGQFDKALGNVDARGFAVECGRASAEDLGLLADMARLRTRPHDAVQALVALRRRFPRSDRAAVAAFNIARVEFDQRASYAEAARWFRTYLREQPSGPLVREAEGRLMEALYRSGDRDGAVRLAERYLAANPNGPHARVARSLLAR